jgi:acetyltransferase-like isoleucine patch superfamily enzyme
MPLFAFEGRKPQVSPIGTEALVGNGATVLDGVVVGRRALVAAGARCRRAWSSRTG